MKNSTLCRRALIIAGLAGFLSLISARADTVYVGCAGDETIRQFTTNGVGTVFTRDSLDSPEGEAFDTAGNLYVANEYLNTITKFTPGGVPSAFAVDPGDNSVLSEPTGLAFDQAGNLYVANEDSGTIERFDTNGVPSVFVQGLGGPEGLAFDTASNLYVANDDDYIEEFAPDGTDLGQFGDMDFLDSPVGLAFDSSGNLYAANSDVAGSATIAEFDTSGNGSLFATNGLDYPEFIVFDTDGNLYVANSGDSNDVEKFDPSGNGSVLINSAIDLPYGLAFDSAENLYVASTGFLNFIQEFDINGVNLTRFATPTVVNPQGMGFDSAGNLYVANSGWSTIEKFDTNGVPSIFAYASGPPYGLVVDSANNVYVALPYSDQISKYTPNGFGSVFGMDDGSGLILNNPAGLAIDSLGNIYAINENVNTMSKFTPSGNGSVFAGIYDFYTHGPGLAVDNSNNVYCLTNFTAIAKFSPAGGVPVPFANDPVQSSDYYYANPQGMAVDSAGNLYLANYDDGTVIKFDTSGNSSIFATNLDAPESITIKRDITALNIPTLAISRSGTNVVLSWSTAASDYNLYSTTNLALGNWLSVAGTRGTNLNNFLMTNPITGSARFFRLSNP